MNIFDEIFKDFRHMTNPPKIASGEIIICFYSGAKFSFPVGTEMKYRRELWTNSPGIHFKGDGFNFTVRPKPPVDFQI